MIKTNYEYKNWVELVVFFAIYFTIVFTPAIVFVHYVFLPVLDGHVDLLKFMNEDGFIDRYGNHLVDRINANDITIDEFSAALFGLMSTMFSPLLWIFPLMLIIKYCTRLAHWFTKKIGVMPMLQLVIIRNGKAKRILRFNQ